MTHADITIDMDRACAYCGRKGTINGGLYLKCVGKFLGAKTCSLCNNPTGRCEDDSIYLDDIGPLCAGCRDEIEGPEY